MGGGARESVTRSASDRTKAVLLRPECRSAPGRNSDLHATRGLVPCRHTRRRALVSKRLTHMERRSRCVHPCHLKRCARCQHGRATLPAASVSSRSVSARTCRARRGPQASPRVTRTKSEALTFVQDVTVTNARRFCAVGRARLLARSGQPRRPQATTGAGGLHRHGGQRDR